MMASIKRIARYECYLTKGASGLWPSDKKVDETAQEMQAQDDNNPDEFLDTVESFVGDGMDEHPNPKDARRDSESPNENHE
jgi:hypothetical protein